MPTWWTTAINLVSRQEMEREMAVKKGNGNCDGKVKNGTGKANRGKANDSNSLVDKNGNMLPAENRGKREGKCQVRRQGLKSTINTETNRKEAKTLPSSSEIIPNYLSKDGTLYELEGKRTVLYFTKNKKLECLNSLWFNLAPFSNRKLFVLLF